MSRETRTDVLMLAVIMAVIGGGGWYLSGEPLALAGALAGALIALVIVRPATGAALRFIRRRRNR